MFFLHIANRTEHLLEHLATVLQNDRQPPFAKELFLVQSQGMERVVCQGLADSLGIFCNYRFFFPLEFLQYVAEKIGLNTSLDGFDRDSMTWRLEALLRNIDAPVYQPLAVYLQDKDGVRKAERRFQLASRLADCFDQYQLMRPEMVLGWQEGKTTTKSAAEEWQMALWQRLLVPKEAEEGEEIFFHRTMLFAQSIELLRQTEEGGFANILPYRISVFGVHTLPPVFLDYLDAFARHSNVHFYLLSPCREYWGDVKDAKTHIKEQLKNSTTSSPSSPSSSGIFLDEESVKHPLLGFLGKQGRDLQNIMADMNVYMEIPTYFDPVQAAYEKGRMPTLLEILQRDLLDGEAGRGGSGTSEKKPDGSLHIVSCHSRVRELEVLHEYLLGLLEENKHLLLRQIIIMAPDIQQYAPFIPSIFHDIEHSVADRSLQLRKPAIAAFSSFLSLFSGKFGRSAVLELLQHQGVAERFSINRNDMEKIIQWVEDVGVYWGLSAEQRQDMGEEAFSFGSFRVGLDRLLMGYAVNCDDFIGDILPFADIEGKQAQALGGFCQFVEFLEQMDRSFRQPRSLLAWRELLLSCIDQFLPDDESSGEMELRKLIFSLGESERFTGEHDIDFSVIEKWFMARVNQSRSSSGFLRGQLTFCSMLPMRSIPFQVVSLLGMNDGVFPQSDRNYTFDLLAAEPRRGDRSSRNDDLYQFLEAIVAARRNLYISYIGQSEKSGEAIPPSVVVSELLELLTKNYGVDIAPVCHPLYPFDSRYFGKSDTFFSYSQEDLEIARIRQESGGNEPIGEGLFPWWRGENSGEAESVSIDELQAFYKEPPSYFIKNILGISLEKEQVVKEDSEPFTLNTLEQYLFDNGLFTKMFYQERAWGKKKFLRYFQQLGQWPLGVPGEISFYRSFAQIEMLVQQAADLGLGKKIADAPIFFTFSEKMVQTAIVGRLGGRYEQGNFLYFASKLKGAHLLSAWIHHLLDNFQQAGGEDGKVRGKLRPTWLLTKTHCGCFSSFPDESEPNLLNLLQLWQKGCKSPLPLYTEPAFAWAQSASKGEKTALKEAINKAENMLEYTPEWNLLLGGKEIRESVESEEFYRYAKEIIIPIYTIFVQGGR